MKSPIELHDKFKNYPLCPERKEVDIEYLLDIQLDRATSLGLLSTDKEGKLKYKGQSKLITNLKPKESYVIHYQYLNFLLEQGYSVTKVEAILIFDEGYTMKHYIDKMVELRVRAKEKKQSCEPDTFKKCMNSLYGKTCECVENLC